MLLFKKNNNTCSELPDKENYVLEWGVQLKLPTFQNKHWSNTQYFLIFFLWVSVVKQSGILVESLSTLQGLITALVLTSSDYGLMLLCFAL